MRNGRACIFVYFNLLPLIGSPVTNDADFAAWLRPQEERAAMTIGSPSALRIGSALADGRARLLGLLLLSRP